MVAGGVLTFTATMAPPDRVLKSSQEKIVNQWTAQPDFFWGIRNAQPPVFRPAIITCVSAPTCRSIGIRRLWRMSWEMRMGKRDGDKRR